MSVLQNLLYKLGVSEFSQLTSEEKETYRQWEEILSGRKLTDEEVINFLKSEIEITEDKLVGMDHSKRQDIFLKMKLEFIKKVILFLNSPKREKEALEKELSNN